jgi:hypothetical protein
MQKNSMVFKEIIPARLSALFTTRLQIMIVNKYFLHEPAIYCRFPLTIRQAKNSLDFLVFENTCAEPCCQDNFDRCKQRIICPFVLHLTAQLIICPF